ncbi:MAG: hypothetical protein RLZZ528_2959 [Pseudomonadota bacterium]
MTFKPPPPAPKGLWRRTPPAVFPVFLGLMGLGLGWRRGAPEFGLPQGLGEAVVGAVTLLAVFGLVTYLVKIARRPGVVAEDLSVLPGRGGIAAMVLVIYLVAVALTPYWPRVATGFLLAGFAAHAVLILLVLRLILSRPGDAARLSPVWHLVFVGPIVGALAAAQLGWVELAAAISIATALAALAIWTASAVQLLREDVPAPLRPFLAIHLAPAALHGQVALLTGNDRMLLVAAGLTVLILAALVLSGRWLLRSGFSPMWGALTFPLAATASLWLGIGGVWRLPGGILLVLATFLILWIARRVLRDWATGALALKTNAAVA